MSNQQGSARDTATAIAPAPATRSVAARLVGGSAVYAAANFAVRAINFFLLPIYTRYLSPAEYGLISLAEILAAVAAIVAGMGLSGAFARLYYQYVGTPQVRRYVSTVLRFGILGAALTAGLAFLIGPPLMSRFAAHFSAPFYPYVALAVVTATAGVLINYRTTLYQIEQRPVAFAVVSMSFFAVTASAALYLVARLHWGAKGMLLGKMVAALAFAIVSVGLLRNWLAGGWAGGYVRESLKLSLPLAPHEFIAAGLVAADRLILQHYRPLSEVGLYSMAYAFGLVMALVTTSLTQAWSPLFFDVARSGDDSRAVLGRISSALTVGLAAVAIIGSFMAAPFIRWFLDPRYAEAGRLVPWVIGGYLMHGWFSLFHLSVLQAKRTGFLLLASATAFAANIALNFALVPRWGMYGAAWATLIAYAVEALVMYVYAQRLFRLSYDRLRLVFALVVFAAGLWLTQAGIAARWSAVGLVTSLALLASLMGREFLQVLTMFRRRTAPGV